MIRMFTMIALAAALVTATVTSGHSNEPAQVEEPYVVEMLIWPQGHKGDENKVERFTYQVVYPSKDACDKAFKEDVFLATRAMALLGSVQRRLGPVEFDAKCTPAPGRSA